MKGNRHIDEFIDDVYTCVRSRCGFCFKTCPVFLVKGFETYTSRGKSMIIKAYLEGNLQLSQDLADRFAHCTGCGFCTSNCDVDRPEIFNAFRKDLMDAGFTIKRHNEICDDIEKHNTPYTEDELPLPQKYKNKINISSPLIYYAGCTARLRERDTLYAMMEILDEFAFLEKPICCGSVLYRTGNKTAAIRQALKLADSLKSYTYLVTACAGCYTNLKSIYPLMGIDIKPTVYHSTQYVSKLLEEGSLHLAKIGTGIKVTYHDPCHLGRHGKIYDEPRDILKKMGFTIVEMPRNREKALCCGGGGGLKSAFDETATKIAGIRATEAYNTKASLLVTTCPFCERNLADGAKINNVPITVVDLTKLVAQAILNPMKL